MTSHNDPAAFGAALSQSAAAELVALRERIQIQYALLDVYERADGRERTASRMEIRDAIGLAAEAGPSAGGGGADIAPDQVEAPEDAPAIPEGAPWWPTHETHAMGLRPNAGWAAYALTQSGTGVIGFSLCGLSSGEVEAGIEMVAATQRRTRNFIPLFLTDQPDLAPFRNRGFVVEYLPATAPSYVSDERWAEYIAARRAFLLRKWNLARIVDIGATLDQGPDLAVADLTGAPDRA